MEGRNTKNTYYSNCDLGKTIVQLMLLSYKFGLRLKYEVKFHKSKRQPHAKKWQDSDNICKILALSLVFCSYFSCPHRLSMTPPQTQGSAVCGPCCCTHVPYKPQAKSRRDPLPCVDSTVDPHCFFVGFIISGELRKTF